MEINNVMRKAHLTSFSKGWWDGWEDLTENQKVENIASKLLMVHCEVSEAAEDLRNSANTKEKLGFDLTDLYYWDEPDQSWVAEFKSIGTTYSTGETTEHLNKPCGFVVELADVIIRVCDMAAQLDVDLDTAVQHKLEYNNTRPHRHGGKLI